MNPEVARCQGWRPMDREAALVSLREAMPSPWRVGDWAQPAVRTGVDALRVPLGMVRLRGITDARNAASLRLMSRLGLLQTFSADAVFRGEACTDVTLERCP
jgi:RimJ/RimL family protein N-acetyltransferase